MFEGILCQGLQEQGGESQPLQGRIPVPAQTQALPQPQSLHMEVVLQELAFLAEGILRIICGSQDLPKKAG